TSQFSSLTCSPPREIYTLSLHDALPISGTLRNAGVRHARGRVAVIVVCRLRNHRRNHGRVQQSRRAAQRSGSRGNKLTRKRSGRSEEHTSELQSPDHLVCRLLLEKKKQK